MSSKSGNLPSEEVPSIDEAGRGTRDNTMRQGEHRPCGEDDGIVGAEQQKQGTNQGLTVVNGLPLYSRNVSRGNHDRS